MGHYGPSLALKSQAPRLSLAWLFIGAQLIDIIWAVLVLFGIERVRIVPNLPASPLDLYYMPFTHSLEGALLWSAVAGILTWWFFGGVIAERRKAGVVMAVVVFSHWILDIIVHRQDLGLFGDSYKIGLGLYDYAIASYSFEGIVLLAGLGWYLHSSPQRMQGRWSHVVVFAFCLLLINALATFGPAPPAPNVAAIFNLIIYFACAGLAAWLERTKPITNEQTRS